MRIPPPRIGAPKREREGDVTSEDEEMKGPEPKRRTSAVEKEDQDMDDPASAPAPPATDCEGQYGTATRLQPEFRYSQRDC